MRRLRFLILLLPWTATLSAIAGNAAECAAASEDIGPFADAILATAAKRKPCAAVTGEPEPLVDKVRSNLCPPFRMGDRVPHLGKAEISLRVAPDGHVMGATIRRSSGDRLVDAAALAGATHGLRYQPFDATAPRCTVMTMRYELK